VPGYKIQTRWFFGAWLVLAIAGSLLAAQPSQRLLPDTTKGYVSVPDIYQLEESWNNTQLGQLLNDPVMNGFGEDMKRQLKKKFTRMRDKLGITLDDLDGVPGGEVAIGMIQPGQDQAALAVLVDITDHRQQADELLEKIHNNLIEKEAVEAKREIDGTTVTIYTLSRREGEKRQRQAVFYIHNNVLCGCDNQEVALAILSRFTGEPTDTLENSPAYRAVMTRCRQAAGDLTPQLRWFVDPFRYIECLRATDLPKKRKRGKDMVKILAAEGFDAVQGIGGYVNFLAHEKYEILHRTSIFAPAVAAPNDEGDKYNRAMRMLQFPNGGSLEPYAWIPRELATYASFNWEVQNAFDTMKTLGDAIIGDEGSVDDVLLGIETDPNGPKINVRKELVAHLGTRVTLITDYELPITPKCERLLFAIGVTNVAALKKSIDRLMEADPNAVRREFNGQVIWEIVEEEDELEGLELELEGLDFGPIGAMDEDEDEEIEVPNIAVSVAYGHLLVASHIEILQKALSDVQPRETLAASADFQVVSTELKAVGDSQISLRFFSRTDEGYRPTYELIRQGRMPEAESIFGKLLNRLLVEDDEEDILREQVIDGSKLPEFEMVRRYFGPVGATIRSEDTGWFVTGFSLNKETPVVAETPVAAETPVVSEKPVVVENPERENNTLR